MARPTTVTRVLTAALDLAERSGPSALTMEGIAAEAKVGKQTLYRTWPSVHDILFDALAAEAADADPPDGEATLFEVLQATVTELSNEPRASLLRMLAAAVQNDEAIAHQFHARLFWPQQAQINRVVAATGFRNPQQTTEFLLAPLLFRWFLRLPPLTHHELHHLIENMRLLEQQHAIRVHGLAD